MAVNTFLLQGDVSLWKQHAVKHILIIIIILFLCLTRSNACHLYFYEKVWCFARVNCHFDYIFKKNIQLRPKLNVDVSFFAGTVEVGPDDMAKYMIMITLFILINISIYLSRYTLCCQFEDYPANDWSLKKPEGSLFIYYLSMVYFVGTDTVYKDRQETAVWYQYHSVYSDC